MKTVSLYGNRPSSLWDFMNEFERAFDNAWTGTESTKSMSSFRPAVDIDESNDHYLISVDLPGVQEKDIKIELNLGQLTISGERSMNSKKERNGSQVIERSFGQFTRTFTLPREVKSDQVQARFDNGVLEVLIPKAEAAQAKAIKIESGKGGLFSRLLGERKEATDQKEH